MERNKAVDTRVMIYKKLWGNFINFPYLFFTNSILLKNY